MSDDMHTRLSRLEWRQDALEESQKRQEDRMSEMSGHINARFDQVIDAIAALKDDSAKQQGAKEARQTTLKWLSLAVGIIGTLAAIGWINTSEAMIPVEMVVDAPIPVQYCTRELP